MPWSEFFTITIQATIGFVLIVVAVAVLVAVAQAVRKK